MTCVGDVSRCVGVECFTLDFFPVFVSLNCVLRAFCLCLAMVGFRIACICLALITHGVGDCVF